MAWGVFWVPALKARACPVSYLPTSPSPSPQGCSPSLNPQSVLVLRTAPIWCRTLHLILLNPMRFLQCHSLGLSRSLWMPSHPSSLSTAPHLSIIPSFISPTWLITFIFVVFSIIEPCHTLKSHLILGFRLLHAFGCFSQPSRFSEIQPFSFPGLAERSKDGGQDSLQYSRHTTDLYNGLSK